MNTQDDAMEVALDSPAGIADLIQNGPGFGPLIDGVCSSPSIQGVNNPVNDLLFLATLREMGPSFIVESTENLLQPVDSVCLDAMPESLWA